MPPTLRGRGRLCQGDAVEGPGQAYMPTTGGGGVIEEIIIGRDIEPNLLKNSSQYHCDIS